jgi:hypothetical protein
VFGDIARIEKFVNFFFFDGKGNVLFVSIFQRYSVLAYPRLVSPKDTMADRQSIVVGLELLIH